MRVRRRLIYGLLTVIAVLFISIYVGVSIGDRIRSTAQSQSAETAELPTPVPDDSATYAPAQNGWKHIQVVAIATDPGFPDPRITPTPTPEPTQRPIPKPTARPAVRPAPPPRNSRRPIWETDAQPETPAPVTPQSPDVPKLDDFGN